MYTSVFALALILAPRMAVPERPAWLTDYAKGMEVGLRLKRPVAVFVGSGAGGQASLVKEGQFSPEAAQLLSQSYVCVYLDRSQIANQRLVREFGIARAGLVISDRSGDYEAFHYDGAIGQTDLTRQLRRFADVGDVATTTISNVAARTSFYDGGWGQSSGFATQPFVRTFSSGSC
jgi:hypothetical protein